MDYSTGWEAGTKSLYLDDVRHPRGNHWFDWIIVRDFRDFCGYITTNGMPKMISFDHDLGYSMPEYATAEEELAAESLPFVQTDQGRFRQDVILGPSGLDAAKWLVDYCLDNDIQMPHFSVHSANPAGAENILCLLNNLQKNQGQIPNGYRTCW